MFLVEGWNRRIKKNKTMENGKEDLARNQTIEFCKVGNEYMIGITDREENRYITRHYRTRKEAQFVFLNLSYAVLYGKYSFEQRKQLM